MVSRAEKLFTLARRSEEMALAAVEESTALQHEVATLRSNLQAAANENATLAAQLQTAEKEATERVMQAEGVARQRIEEMDKARACAGGREEKSFVWAIIFFEKC